MELKINWGGFENLGGLSLKYDKYFMMAKFFANVPGIEDYSDSRLLEVYDKLPEVTHVDSAGDAPSTW